MVGASAKESPVEKKGHLQPVLILSTILGLVAVGATVALHGSNLRLQPAVLGTAVAAAGAGAARRAAGSAAAGLPRLNQLRLYCIPHLPAQSETPELANASSP